MLDDPCEEKSMALPESALTDLLLKNVGVDYLKDIDQNKVRVSPCIGSFRRGV